MTPVQDNRAILRHARHALRTPLNGILGYAELLQENALDANEKELAEQFAYLGVQGRALLELVNELMAESRCLALPTIEPRQVGRELSEAFAPPLGRLAVAVDGLIARAQAEDAGELASAYSDLSKIKLCGEQLRSIVDGMIVDGFTPSVPVPKPTFPIELPCIPAPGPRGGDLSGSRQRGSASILVVEDHAPSRELLARQLSRMGHSVTQAENGLEALNLMRRINFDLALLDLHMPAMSGFSVLAAMRSEPALRRVPVIVVSGMEDMESVIRSMKLGAIDHLSKPFDATLLSVRVRAALALAQGSSAEPASPVGPVSSAATTARSEDDPDVQLSGMVGFFRFLWGWTGPYRKHVVIFALGLVASMLITAALPLGFKYLTDLALVPRNLRMGLLILGVLLAAEVISIVVNLARDYFFSRFTAKFLNDIRFSLFRHLQRLSLGFYGRVSPGEVIGRFTTDLEAVDGAVVNFLSTVLCQAVLVPITLALIFALEWRLALISTLGILVSMKSARWMEPIAEKDSHRLKAEQARIATVLQENVQAQPVVKVFRLQTLLVEDFKHQLVGFYRTAARACFTSYVAFRVPSHSAALFGLLTLAVGSIMVYYDTLTVGGLVAFQMLQTNLTASVSELTWGLPQFLKAAAGIQRIQWLLDQKPDIEDPAEPLPLSPPAKEIAFENVRFGYSSDRLSLDGVSFSIPMGKSVLLVGPSGSGKSSVLNLLLRYYDPAEGRVCIDNRDVRSVAQDDLRSHMSVVLQDSFLFNTTIRENILMGNREASAEQIEAAARLAEVHDDVTRMPDGYETVVGERGCRLSGGQRQRVAIARALLSNPSILLLDEATSALDPQAAAAVNNTLERISKGRTVVSATHHFESAPTADHILVFKSGCLVEQGTHDDLLRTGELYPQLWQQQAVG